MNTIALVITLLSCLWLSWYITRRFILFAMEQQVLDVPNGRSSHTFVTPRGGGISFALVFAGTTALFALMHRLSALEAIGLSAGMILVVVGYLDDRHGLSIKTRLMAHLVAAAIATYCFVGPSLPRSSTTLLFILAIGAISVVTITWLINLFNFMDGIDGLAASESICVAGVCSLLTIRHGGPHEVSLLFAVLAATCLGFLFWNWAPAHIFMGDAGSCFLGYTIGALSLFAAARGELSLWAPAVMVGVFVIDASLTLFRRFRRGEAWYKPHRLHAFQHACEVFGHRNTTTAVVAINLLWLAPWAALADAYPTRGLAILIVAWSPILALAYLFHAGEVLCPRAIPRWRSVVVILDCNPAPALRRLSQRSISHIARNMRVYKFLSLTLASLLCAYVALFSEGADRYQTDAPRVLAFVAAFVVGQTATLLVFGLHRYHWCLASIEELPNIVGMALASTLFGFLTGAILTGTSIGFLPSSDFILECLLLGFLLIVGHALAVVLSRGRLLAGSGIPLHRIVIYGADAVGMGIATELRRLGPSYRFIGYIDSRSEMTGMQISGGSVLGSDADICTLVQTYRIDRILISSLALRSDEGQEFVRRCQSLSLDYRIILALEQGIEAGPEALRVPASVMP